MVVRVGGTVGGGGPAEGAAGEVVERGWEWLEGRQERDDWTYVWQALLTTPDLQEGRRAELLERGWEWARGNLEKDKLPILDNWCAPGRNCSRSPL